VDLHEERSKNSGVAFLCEIGEHHRQDASETTVGKETYVLSLALKHSSHSARPSSCGCSGLAREYMIIADFSNSTFDGEPS
jgi:outer membrane lipopolysaccharide assembly protein LptE/RlpB